MKVSRITSGFAGVGSGRYRVEADSERLESR